MDVAQGYMKGSLEKMYDLASLPAEESEHISGGAAEIAIRVVLVAHLLFGLHLRGASWHE